MLVEEPTLDQAEAQCLADAQLRGRRRERDAVRRAEDDLELQTRMAAKIALCFRAARQSERTKSLATPPRAKSGRVCRSAGGRQLEDWALELAVTASVRHRDTPYDSLLMAGIDRSEARERVRGEVARIIAAWRAR